MDGQDARPTGKKMDGQDARPTKKGPGGLRPVLDWTELRPWNGSIRYWTLRFSLFPKLRRGVLRIRA
jgi:hypothetical protein